MASCGARDFWFFYCELKKYDTVPASWKSCAIYISYKLHRLMTVGTRQLKGCRTFTASSVCRHSRQPLNAISSCAVCLGVPFNLRAMGIHKTNFCRPLYIFNPCWSSFCFYVRCYLNLPQNGFPKSLFANNIQNVSRKNTLK